MESTEVDRNPCTKWIKIHTEINTTNCSTNGCPKKFYVFTGKHVQEESFLGKL